VRDRSSSVNRVDGETRLRDGANVLFSVWSVARAVSDLLDTALAPSGLDADEFAVYSVLAVEGALTPTDLARWMAAPTTTVSSYIKRFEARGHVRRDPNPNDRRSYRVRLTQAGRRAHRKAAALFVPTLRQVVDALGDDEQGTRTALLNLRAALDVVRQPAPPAGRPGPPTY
jgi:DNA-binding MarR family transcriptional regulator